MAALQNIKKQTQKSAQQQAHAAAQQIKDQTIEFAKSTTQQVFPHESKEQNISSDPLLVQDLQTQGPSQLNAEEIHRREQELLGVWRLRLAQIQSEQQGAHIQNRHQLEAWKKQQEELMQQAVQKQDQEVIMPTGKPKGPMAGSSHERIKSQIDTRRETGRGAKN
jgi:hypothetical protein